MDCLYYCTNENNDCPKKNDCKRFLEINDNCHATLYKEACTEQNSHVLFIEKELKEGEISSC